MDTQSHQMKRNIDMKQLDGTMVNPKPNQVIFFFTFFFFNKMGGTIQIFF